MASMARSHWILGIGPCRAAVVPEMANDGCRDSTVDSSRWG